MYLLATNANYMLEALEHPTLKYVILQYEFGWYLDNFFDVRLCYPYFFQGVTKGLVAEKIFTKMAESGKHADFVCCVGDDRSDEDMFEIIGSAMNSGILSSNTSVYACTVGQKPSKAKYYLDDTAEVITMLDALADVSDPFSSSDDEPGSPS